MIIAINAAVASWQPYITIVVEEDDCDLTFISNGSFWYMPERCVVYTDKNGVNELRCGNSVKSGTAASYNTLIPKVLFLSNSTNFIKPIFCHKRV